MPERISFDRLLNVRSAYGATFDADGRRLYFVSTTSGVPGLWGLRLDQPEAWPEPLAVGPERVQYAFAGPRPGQVIFGLDRGGNERTQLMLLEGAGRSARPLTDEPEAIHHFGGWDRDGREISFASNERDPRYFDVHTLDPASGERRCLLQDDSTNYAGRFDPTGRWLLVQRVHSPSEHELLVVDRSDGTVRSLTADGPAGRYLAGDWSTDGRSIICLTDRAGDLLAPVSIELEGGRVAPLAVHQWDVDDLALSPDGRRLALAVNRNGYSDVAWRDPAGHREQQLPTPRRGLCYDAGRWTPTFAWSPDGRRLACTFSASDTPLDVWLLQPGGEPCQVTRSFAADLAPEQLVEPELVHYPTFDGRRIPAFVYRPPGHRTEGTAPALFFVHGGPESQFRPSFNPVVQYFAARGFVVVAPNVRGSTGYGKAYSHLDDVELRLDSVRDLAAGAEWLAAAGEAHPRKIAVMGGSYGGYMVLAALTERPDLWAAGVDIVGIANFVTFLERTGPWRRRHREAEYGSLEHHRPLLERLSPLNRVDQIAAPLMVIHGANDPRVPVGEAEQIVASLRGRGRPVEYLRFEDEGHGLVKLENRLAAYPRIAEFLERALGVG